MISFKPLWHTLIERDIGKLQLMEMVGFSRGTLAKMGHNEYVAMSVIDSICRTLGCRVEEVMEFVPDQEVVEE